MHKSAEAVAAATARAHHFAMPDKDGYEFIREVRNLSISQGGRIPPVALTAFARSEHRTRAMLAGYQVHMSKPLEPLELRATVATLTGRTVRTSQHWIIEKAPEGSS